MRARTTVSEIDTQIGQLKEKRKTVVAKANDRFAAAAQRAGLAELNISDAELDEVLAEITARFRGREKRTAGESA